MKALQFLQPEKRLELREVPWPEPREPNDVVVRVAYSGVCGSDLHAHHGWFPMLQRWTTMGHELSGVVAAVGSAVTSCAVGDRVSVDPNFGCGRCERCKLGDVHLCPTQANKDSMGFWRDGGWAEATVAPEQSIHRLPDTLPLSRAALCEPLSCMLHAHDLFEPIPAHGRIVILGAGIIGVLTACLLHHRGVRNVTVSEPAAARRRFVDELELGYRTVTPAELEAEFDGKSDLELAADGIDVVIDCSGYCPAIEKAAGWLRSGGKLCLFGVAPADGKISLSPNQLVNREIRVQGAIINPLTYPRATALAAAMGDRYLELGKLGVELFPLERYEEAMEKLKKGAISKAMFAVDPTLQ